MNRRPLALLLLVPVLAFAAGCGGDDDDTSSATTGATTSTATVPESATTPDDAAAAPAVSNATDLDSKPKIAKPTGSPPTTLVKKDLVVGTGPAAEAGDAVTVQYVGVSFSNGEQFDASWDSGQPFAFTLGQGEVIAGWDQGVVGMKVGGRRLLVIPPDLGYGEQGQGPILPRETLVFVVDLKKIN